MIIHRVPWVLNPDSSPRASGQVGESVRCKFCWWLSRSEADFVDRVYSFFGGGGGGDVRPSHCATMKLGASVMGFTPSGIGRRFTVGCM
jgi:hypothetical protein